MSPTGASMNLQQLPGKIAKRLSHYAFKSFGIDGLLLKKVKGRNDLREIGTKYGGWVIPVSLFDSNSICYCVGCGEDISFDLGLIDKFGCDVYAFDPTPRAIKYVNEVAGQNSKYHFFDVGLWDKEDTLKFYTPRNPDHVSHSLLNLQQTDDYILVRVNRLINIMKELGHNRIDLLKIDIEGAEYKVIESIVADRIDIKVICIEYDECFNLLDDKFKERIRDSIKTLKGYSLVCAQGNGNYTFVKNAFSARLWPFDNLQPKPTAGAKPQQPRGQETRVSAISPNQTQPGKPMPQNAQQRVSAIAVLDISARDDDGQ